MKKILLSALLATTMMSAHAAVVMDTDNFEQSVDTMTASMANQEKTQFMQSLAKYSMFKTSPQDLTLNVDAMNKRTFAEFDGLTAQEILKAIELSYEIKKQAATYFAEND